MRARIGVIAAAAVASAAALLVPAPALALSPANEIFYPEGQEPPEPEPVKADPERNNPASDRNTPARATGPGTVNADAADVDLGALNDRDREEVHARGSRMAVDLMGFMPSLYEGKWFMPGKEDLRRCILDRESNFNYRANNGTYFGAYQMSRALARGATWMMQAEVRREMGNAGVDIVQGLRELTPDKWNRYWQDRAFWTVWRNGNGASHWHGGC